MKNDYSGVFAGVKRPGREAEQLPSSGVEIKEWIGTSIPPIRLNGVDKRNFTFLIFVLIAQVMKCDFLKENVF